MEIASVVSQSVIGLGTILLAVLGIIITRKQFKSTNFVSITTNHRLTKMIGLQEECRDILSNSDTDYVDVLHDHSDIIKNITVAVCSLRANMHLGFKPDMELIIQSETIKKRLLAYISAGDNKTQKKDAAEKLNADRLAFAKLCDIYCSTEWQRIKEETSGNESIYDDWGSKYIKNQEFFDSNEKEFLRQIENI